MSCEEEKTTEKCTHEEEKATKKCTKDLVKLSKGKKGSGKKAKPAGGSAVNIFEAFGPMPAIGPKQISILMKFLPSALMYSTAGLILTIYMCEWKAVLQYLPYYNGKYVVDSPKKKEDEA